MEPLELEKPSQGLLRTARSLVRRKEREAQGRFLVEGKQAVREALLLPGCVESLFLRWGAALEHEELINIARKNGVEVYGVSEQNIGTMSNTVTPQGVIAIARNVDTPIEKVFDSSDAVGLVVICAQIRDPGNLGTVIRCADAFGADAVIVSSDSVDLYNAKTVRASVGSIFHLPVVIGADLKETIEFCRNRGLQVFATDGEAGKDLTTMPTELKQPTAWVMGNESWGLPVEHLQLADQTVAVPIYGQAESLNLATAAAVCLFASASAQRQ